MQSFGLLQKFLIAIYSYSKDKDIEDIDNLKS